MWITIYRTSCRSMYFAVRSSSDQGADVSLKGHENIPETVEQNFARTLPPLLSQQLQTQQLLAQLVQQPPPADLPAAPYTRVPLLPPPLTPPPPQEKNVAHKSSAALIEEVLLEVHEVGAQEKEKGHGEGL